MVTQLKHKLINCCSKILRFITFCNPTSKPHFVKPALCTTPTFLGTVFCYEHFASDTLEFYHAVFDPRTYVFLSFPLLNRTCTLRNVFFLPLNNCNSPVSFRKPPSFPLPATRRTQCDLTAQQYSAIDLLCGQ